MDSKDRQELAGHLTDLKVCDKDSLEHCSILHDLADLYFKNGDFELAKNHYADALRVCQVNKECNLQIADIYAGYGESLMELGNYAEAEENSLFALLETSIRDTKDSNAAVNILYTLSKIYHLDNRQNVSKKMTSMASPIRANISNNLTTHHVIDILNEMAITLYSKQQVKISNKIFIGIIEARKKRFEGQEFAASRFMTSFGEMLRVQGKDDEALVWYIDAMNVRKAINSLESTKDSRLAIADSYSNLGLVYRAQGKFDEAESYLMNSLDIRREELNGRGAVVGSTLNNIAELYRDRGQFGQALMFHETCINTFQACLPPDHPNIINAKGNLGVTLRHQARSGNMTGDDLLKSSVKYLKENNYKEDHPWVKKFKMEICYSKANELSEDGEYDEAMKLYHMLIESKRFSDESRITKMVMKELWLTKCRKAVHLRDQGCFLAAKALFRECMDESEMHVASNDSIMCEYTFAQAENMRQMGLTDDAMELYNVLMKIRIEQFGESHPLIARLKNALASCEMEKGHYLESKSLFKQALEIINLAIENENDSAFVDKFNYTLKANVLSDFSELNRRMSSFFKAKDKQDEALELKMKYHGIHTNEVANSYYSTAKILYSIGRLEAAETFNNKAYDIWNHIFDDPNHPKIANSFVLSAMLDIENGKCDRARVSMERALSVYEMIFPPEYPDVVYGIYMSGRAFLASGLHRQAEQCFQRAHTISIQSIGKFSTLAGLCAYAEGLSQSDIGHYGAASKLFREALTIQEQSLGKYHPDFIETLIAKGNNHRLNCEFIDAAQTYDEAATFMTSRDVAYSQSSTRASVEMNSVEQLPSYATFVIAKARLAMDMCEFDKAQDLLNKALALRVVMYGEQHQYVLAVKHLQYECMRLRGQDISELKGLFTHNIVGMSMHWGEDHLCVAKMNMDRANFRVNYNQINVKTRASMLECSYVVVRCHGKVSVHYANILTSLGLLMTHEEHFSEAEQYFDEAADIYLKTVGKEHGLFGILLNNKAELARLRCNDEESAELNKAAMDIIVAVYGEDHPLTMNIDGNCGLLAMRSESSRAEGIQKVIEIHTLLLKSGFGAEHPWIVKFQEGKDVAEADNMSLTETSSCQDIRDVDSVERMVVEMEDMLDMKSDEIKRLQKLVDEKDALLAAAAQMEALFSAREDENSKEIEDLRKQLALSDNRGIDDRKRQLETEEKLDKETRSHKQLMRSNTANDRMIEIEQQKFLIADLEGRLLAMEAQLSSATLIPPAASTDTVGAGAGAGAGGGGGASNEDDNLQLTITLALRLKRELEECQAELHDVHEELMHKCEESTRLTRKLQTLSAKSSRQEEGVAGTGNELLLLIEENNRLKRHIEDMRGVEDDEGDTTVALREENARLRRKLEKAIQDSESDDVIELKEDVARARRKIEMSNALHAKSAMELKQENVQLREKLQERNVSTADLSLLENVDAMNVKEQLVAVKTENVKLWMKLESVSVSKLEESNALCQQLNVDLAKAMAENESLRSVRLSQLELVSPASPTDDAGQMHLLTSLSLQLKEDLDAAVSVKNELSEEINELKKKLSQDHSQVDLLTSLSLKLKFDLDNAVAQLHDRPTQEIISSSADSEQLAQQVEELLAEVSQLKSSLDAADAKHISSMTAQEAAFKALETNLAILQGDDTANQLQEALSAANGKIKTLSDENVELVASLGESNSGLEALRKVHAEATEEHDKAQANATATMTELNSQIDTLSVELTTLKEAKAATESELELCQASLATAQLNKQMSDASLANETAANKENQRKVNDLTELLSSTKSNLDQVTVKVVKLTEESNDYARKRSNFETHIAHLKSEVETKGATIKKLLETINELEKELDRKVTEIKTMVKDSLDVRTEVVLKRAQVEELLLLSENLKEKLAFSNNQRKNMDPWGFRKEAELGFSRFDTRLRTPKEDKKVRQPDIARHFESLSANSSPSSTHKSASDSKEVDVPVEENDPTISSHIDDLMLGSVPSRHFSGVKDLYAKSDTHRYVDLSPTSSPLPNVKRPSTYAMTVETEQRAMQVSTGDGDFGHHDDPDFEDLVIVSPPLGSVQPPGNNEQKNANLLSKSQPVLQVSLLAPSDSDSVSRKISSATGGNGSRTKSANKKSSTSGSTGKGSVSSVSKKELNPIIHKNSKHSPTSAGITHPAPSSIAKSSDLKRIPVIARVNNYMEILPVAKKFGVYGCLDSTTVAIGKGASSQSRVPTERRGTKDLVADDSRWIEDDSIMESIRLDSLESLHTRDTFKQKPSGFW